MKLLRLLLALSWLGLAACSRTTGTPTPAATASLLGTEPPTSLPVSTATFSAATQPQPTSTAVAATLVVPPTSESVATTSASVPTETSAPTGPLVDRAQFISDVTVPDGTDYGPGATFVKTWQVKNVGTTTWTTQYVIEFVIGANLAATNTVNLPNDVPPGATVDISVNMTAPATPGNYTSLWQFKSPAGNKFGVGPNFNEAIYVQIDVIAGLPVGTPKATSAVATSTGPLNPIKVTKVTMKVDNATFTGECPHIFVFTALLDVEGGGVVKYQLEVSTTTEGFQLDLPAPIESNFASNAPQTFGAAFTLEMRDTVQGQAWLHIVSPVDMQSEKVSFSLTCPARPTRTPVLTAATGTTPAASATATP